MAGLRELALASSLAAVFVTGGCQASPGTVKPTTVPTLSAPPSGSQALKDEEFVGLGASAVGFLACDQNTVAWSTSSNTDPKKLFLDTIEASATNRRAVRQVARAVHGGQLGAQVAVSGNWVVFTEYQQAGQSSSTDFWFIRAVDIVASRSIEIAGSRVAPQRLELPSISVSGDLVVWDELVSSTRKVLKVYHLSSRALETLPLSSGTFPVDPQIDGSRIIFLDNQTDPNKSGESFLSRGGHLMLFDLRDHRLLKLDSTDDARQPQLSGDLVVWHATVPDPDHPNSPSTVFDVRLSPTDAGKSRVLASLGYRGAISNSNVVWFNDRLPDTFTYSIWSQRTQSIGVAALETSAPTYALCGKTLYFTPLEPQIEHSIRLITLPG